MRRHGAAERFRDPPDSEAGRQAGEDGGCRPGSGGEGKGAASSTGALAESRGSGRRGAAGPWARRRRAGKGGAVGGW